MRTLGRDRECRGTTIGSSQAARTPIQSGCGRRSRQRAAAFGRWRHRRRHRSPPRFGAVVFRHDPDRRLRRGPDGRRRFCVARRRNQFRHRAGADREHAARRHRRDRRQARQPQERPAAAGRRKPAPPARSSAISNTTKVGDREVVRTRPLVRVSANLTMTSTEFAASVPPFNRAEAAGAGRRRRRAGRRSAGRRARRRSLLRDARSRRRPAEGQDRIRAADRRHHRARARHRQLERRLAEPLSGREPAAERRRRRCAYAADGTPDPYAGFETRIVPENITLLPKTGTQATGGNGWNERSVTVKKGDNIATILKEIGATPEEIAAIAAALGPARPQRRPEGRPEAPHPGRLHAGRLAAAADPRDRDGRQRDRGGGRALRHGQIRLGRRRQHEHAGLRAPSDDEEDDGKGMRLYQSIYETALRNNIPKPVIEALIRIYSYDVDFQHKAQPGDSFDVLYAGEDDEKRRDVRRVDHRRRAQEILSLPDHRRRHRRLLRRDRKEREEVPGPQAGRRRNHAVRLRRPQSSAAGLLQDAHRRRLGRPARHRDLRLRQRHHRQGRLGERLRQIRPHQALQRLRDRLRPHDRVLALDPARARASARAR